MAEELANDVDKAILILNILNLDHFSQISAPITAAATRTRARLLITIYSPFFDNTSGTSSWDVVQRLLTHVYVQATSVAQKHNKILMSVDVLLRGIQGPANEEPIDDWDMVFYSGNYDGAPIPPTWLSLSTVHLPNYSEPPTDPSYPPPSLSNIPLTYPVVALGGTFDHLHAGHKILLSMASWITKEKIIVGVTDDALLSKKSHKNLLEPISTRVDAVRDFLRLFKPGLIYCVVPISDVYGPTGWDSNIQALVVSKETLSGAASIASRRNEKSLPPLRTFVIDVISASSANLETDDAETLKNTKMSSTFIREWIHEQRAGNAISTSETQHEKR